jgi:hypothetical protein
MTAIDRTIYRRMKRSYTTKELIEAYTPTEEDVIYQDKNTVSQKMCHVAKRIQRMGFLS